MAEVSTSKAIDAGCHQYSLEEVDKLAVDILSHGAIRPGIGIVCGTGLGNLANQVRDSFSVDYKDIPGFPVSTVKGHIGRFVVGYIGDVPVVLMVGRLHYYEGYPMTKVTLPIRVMSRMGVKALIITNASGGLNQEYKTGDIMILKDHINLSAMTGNNPLRGPNDDRVGPRFLDTRGLYDADLRRTFKEVASGMDLSSSIREGIYFYDSGPTFSSLAESILLRNLGVDAVGMSTVPEAVVARHSGVKVFACSLITDMMSLDEECTSELTHEEVLKAANEKTEELGTLIKTFLSKIWGQFSE